MIHSTYAAKFRPQSAEATYTYCWDDDDDGSCAAGLAYCTAWCCWVLLLPRVKWSGLLWLAGYMCFIRWWQKASFLVQLMMMVPNGNNNNTTISSPHWCDNCLPSTCVDIYIQSNPSRCTHVRNIEWSETRNGRAANRLLDVVRNMWSISVRKLPHVNCIHGRTPYLSPTCASDQLDQARGIE